MKKYKNIFTQNLTLIIKILFNYADFITDINFVIIFYDNVVIKHKKSLPVYSVFYILIVSLIYERF